MSDPVAASPSSLTLSWQTDLRVGKRLAGLTAGTLNGNPTSSPRWSPHSLNHRRRTFSWPPAFYGNRLDSATSFVSPGSSAGTSGSRRMSPGTFEGSLTTFPCVPSFVDTLGSNRATSRRRKFGSCRGSVSKTSKKTGQKRGESSFTSCSPVDHRSQSVRVCGGSDDRHPRQSSKWCPFHLTQPLHLPPLEARAGSSAPAGSLGNRPCRHAGQEAPVHVPPLSGLDALLACLITCPGHTTVAESTGTSRLQVTPQRSWIQGCIRDEVSPTGSERGAFGK